MAEISLDHVGKAFSGTPATHVLRGTPEVLPGLGDGQAVSQETRRKAVAAFLAG